MYSRICCWETEDSCDLDLLMRFVFKYSNENINHVPIGWELGCILIVIQFFFIRLCKTVLQFQKRLLKSRVGNFYMICEFGMKL
jgi:hypothetical protein